VTQDPIKRSYYFSPLIFDLASRPIVNHQNLILCAYEEMRQLRDLTRETVAIHIRVGLERICLEELQSPENLKLTSGRGYVSPIYTSSIGKILLSQLDDKELHLLMKNIRLAAISPNTITDKEVLWKELQQVRKQGYATSFGERIEGAGSISVPVRNYACPVALSVWGPDNRFTLNVMLKYVGEITDCARRISNKLAERGERSGRGQREIREVQQHS
jgi:DNA-binding IclR family transcriptional regulator